LNWEESIMLLPELFALLSSDLFLLLSLLTCLLEERFPKAMPYVYQIAALMGFGHLMASKAFLTVFGEDMRFWYNFFYLAVGLANIVAVNVYLAVSKKMWTLAKVWSASVTFPTVFISIFFIYNYGYLQGATFPMLTMDLILILSVAILGIGVAVLLSSKLSNRMRRR
jgi:uncharacterized membrane protein